MNSQKGLWETVACAQLLENFGGAKVSASVRKHAEVKEA